VNTRERFGFAERVSFDERWLVSGERVEWARLNGGCFFSFGKKKKL